MFSNIKISQGNKKEFVKYCIDNWKNEENSDFVNMKQGYDYYNNNGEILNKKKLVTSVDLEGKPYERESQLLSNTKLSHSFYKKLVKQKVSYVLSHPFTLKATYTSTIEQVDSVIKTIQPYIDDSLYTLIQNAGRDCIACKYGWIYTYYDDNANLRFSWVDPLQVIPIWKNNEQKELDAVIHCYERYEFSSQYDMTKLKTVKCVDYYEKSGRTKYEFEDNGKLKEVESQKPYITFKNQGYGWDRIPWTWFKYDSDGSNLLMKIKSLIDEYDFLTSYISDMIKDSPNALLVIKGFSAGSVEEFVRNAANYRKLFVQSDGDVSSVEQPLQIDQMMLHLAQLRKDIFEFAQGVDTTDDKNLRDTSGVALKFTYAELDMDCSYWSVQLKQSIHNLIYFILTDVRIKEGKDLTDIQFDIIFNTDVIINEVDTIQNCVNSIPILPLESIIEQHPWVVNAVDTYKNMKQQQDDEFNKEKQLQIDVKKTQATNNTKNVGG